METSSIKEISEQISKAVLEIFKSNDSYFRYLDIAARLHDMTYENVLLIQLHNKDAVHVESKDMWLSKGRNISNGEKSLLIIYPKIVRAKVNDKNVIMQSYDSKSAYDVSQTFGKDIIQNYEMDEVNIKFAEKMMRNQIDNIYFQNKTEVQSIEYIVSKKFDINVSTDKFVNMGAWSSNKTGDELGAFLHDIQLKSHNIIGLIDNVLVEKNKLISHDQRKTLTDIKNGVELYRRQNDVTNNGNTKENKREER